MRRIEVGGPQPYAVEVGRGVLGAASVSSREVALLHDSALPSPWVERARAALSPALTVALPSGEACKTLGVLEDVLSRLARAGLSRDGAVVGLGGGAATDLAGFAAASYLRGVAFYTAPTTLLGMVDAALGGKTGVNLPEGKNLVGAFWPPRAVWADLDTLNSLPDATFREGAAEVFKHGLIQHPALCDAVLTPDFGPRAPNLEDVVADAVAVKAGVVTRDLTERGERAFLNFGHTLAHALEAATDHRISHGFAVGYGMHYAAILSRLEGGADLTPRTRAFLRWQQPSPLPSLSWPDLRAFMGRDKKADAAGLRFVLLRDLGQPYLARLPEATLQRAYAEWSAEVTATPPTRSAR